VEGAAEPAALRPRGSDLHPVAAVRLQNPRVILSRSSSMQDQRPHGRLRPLARRRRALEAVEKVVTGRLQRACPTLADG
jgi:hypothetical protein